VARRRVIIGVVAAVAVIGLLWFLFGRGEDGPLGQILGSSAPPVEQFHFKTVDAKPEAAQAHLDKNKLEKAAKHNAPAIEHVLTQVLQTGYIDPEGWGDAGAIDDSFTDEAAKQVEPHVDTLTLGKDAPDTVESVKPLPSKLKVTTLIDGELNPIRALGEITFKAKATNTDGTTTKITLTGTFFLVPDGDTWKIEAFHLQREMKPRKAASSASASPAASEAG
jgi:hypothetical protein